MDQATQWAARLLVERARDARATLAVAESLTAGLVTAAIAAVPGASAVLRGGVTAYASEVKASVLGVDRALLDAQGPVDEDVARQMARGAARLMGARTVLGAEGSTGGEGVTGGAYGLATTGVAGPGPADGHPAGTVWIAVHGPQGARTRRLTLAGPRAEVRVAATAQVLALAAEMIGDAHEQDRGRCPAPGGAARE